MSDIVVLETVISKQKMYLSIFLKTNINILQTSVNVCTCHLLYISAHLAHWRTVPIHEMYA